MALQIDGPASLITIPQADLTATATPGVYELDTDAFRLELKDWEDSMVGMAFTKTHNHNTEVTFAGTTFARQVIMVAPWQVQFEDTGGQYAVILTGSNNNLFDVAEGIFVPTPGVSVIPTNSAGLIVREGDTSGLTPDESATLNLILELMRAGHTTPDGQVIITLRNGDTYTTTAWEDPAGTVPHDGGAIRKTDPISDTPDP